ncbi:GNAT family N-acetyltransferase [Sphingomonas xinjiangensis]|uniref:GNAT superfamily N-acetyltransferase n=1 Tax=Sphingomonas xinjiangensis TaxID=643568 RepID=A0A840YQI8_9SPHN|nr:GNAT family N-acetyltransferase [Sphingomonas xinjiangensis]MBB5710982.1 GNAT superfamily N-acetyltransferase [Sphingomonas xinjiangensis]
MAESFVARLRRRAAQQGVRRTLAKLWGDHVFRHSESVILECNPELLRAGDPRAAEGIEFLTLRRGDAVPPLCPWLAHRRGDFDAMLADGKLGLFVLRDGVAVGCVWVSIEDHHDPKAREHYRVAPGEAYHYSLLVEPEERRRGTSMAFSRYFVSSLRSLGIQRQFGVVDRANRASYQVLSHFGYRECGVRVRHFYLLHTRWTRVSSYAGTLGLSEPRRRRRA